ncbi:hypothetical protein [Kingella negevensis]|uniref:hypothetical protein n=1 Tax=Kingella negevensis TaxID=1522312 RepID=UPI000A267391|nr:hypothetical protein [Kingella negevensis]WII91726.1 hypothetical protein QEO93_03855 [Kingella negevensis]
MKAIQTYCQHSFGKQEATIAQLQQGAKGKVKVKLVGATRWKTFNSLHQAHQALDEIAIANTGFHGYIN